MVELAEVLDELIGDAEATRRYAAYVRRYVSSGRLLELACGTGALATHLAQHFNVEGLDLDAAMLKQFAIKNPQCVMHHRSMIDLSGLGEYDVIVCFGDSLNYLTADEDLDRFFAEVDAHLRPGGVFLFDVHTEARLIEFETEFIEEGHVGNVGYQWTIQTMPHQHIDHQLTLYDTHGSVQRHQIIQRVFSLTELESRLKRLNWTWRIASDFEEGIDPQAEKYMLACRKERL